MIKEGVYRTGNEEVELRGTFLKGRKQDLPTMIWFSDLVDPANNFVPFFSRPDNKILDVRNVWCLDIRNFGDSDHHDSFAMEVSDLFNLYLNTNLNVGHFRRCIKIYGQKQSYYGNTWWSRIWS